MKALFHILIPVVVLSLAGCAREGQFVLKTGESNGYSYEYVTNDPLKVRIYTLSNGLKIYLSQYPAEPRLQTAIAVKAGGKFDPANATGLAHYLEHIMFKGTADFGTQDWEKERVYLDSIEAMFEKYRTLTDSVDRVNYYKKIDTYSNEASQLAIANEYDKMLAVIGARGTNAYTTEDRTVYINDIPANHLENWLQIESNRFRIIVPRLFHTELEAVYEEKNRSLDNDYWKAFEAMHAAAFTKHPYGTQTVIGTIDHLKNPSITEIKNYFYKYYRPNNVALCLSGDLDYDKTIALIDKYFGSWEPNPDLSEWRPVEEDPIPAPVVRDVFGPDAEWVNLAFRFRGTGSEEFPLLRLTDMILSNSQAGLIDLNLRQQQKVIEPISFVYEFNDYSLHVLTGRPREGQDLEQVKELLLGQIDLIKRGEFEDWLVEAVINDLKKTKLQQSQNNWSRSDDMVMAFTNGISWERKVGEFENLRQYTKEDIVRFANQHYGDNYVVINKRTGKDPNTKKVVKPAITEVALNREAKSEFVKMIESNPVDKIQPVFLDYAKDITRQTMNGGVEVISTQNNENELFTLYYLSDLGSNHYPRLKEAVEYLQYLGTAEMSSEDFKKEFYKLGCSFNVWASPEQTYVALSGLSENMVAALTLFEKLLAAPAADQEALRKMIDGDFKKRDDAKKDKSAILWEGLMNYGLYGAESPFTNVVSNRELRSLQPAELIDLIREFTSTQHRVLYYGPQSPDDLLAVLNANHRVAEPLKEVPAISGFAIKDVEKPKVYWTHYDMVQAEIFFLTNGEAFDATRIPEIRMFNEYFDGSMSSPVFQELREARGLAYSAFANYSTAGKVSDTDYFYAYIGTQADKQPESMDIMQGLLKNFPTSENGFHVAVNSLMNRIESERITKTAILFNYETARRRGLDHDVRREVYDQVQNMTLEDLAGFHQRYLKDKKYNIVLLGDRSKLNFKALSKYGDVQELSLDEIFGYEKPQKISIEKPN
jgi:predicted Zn-dependent peptidase